VIRATELIGEALSKRNATAEEVLYQSDPVEASALERVIDRYLENNVKYQPFVKSIGLRLYSFGSQRQRINMICNITSPSIGIMGWVVTNGPVSDTN